MRNYTVAKGKPKRPFEDVKGNSAGLDRKESKLSDDGVRANRGNSIKKPEEEAMHPPAIKESARELNKDTERISKAKESEGRSRGRDS